MNQALKEKTAQNAILTGFNHLDQQIGGLRKGELYVLASRTSVGKSAKMLQMAKQMAQQHQGECFVCSQEMRRHHLIDRLISNYTEIPVKWLRQFRSMKIKKCNSVCSFKMISKALDELSDLPLHLYGEGRTNINEVREISKEIERSDGPLCAIFIDYLEMLNISMRKGMTMDQAIGEEIKKAKDLAVELDCAVILLAQIPQPRHEGPPYKPSLLDMEQGEYIQKYADIVEILWEDPDDQNAGPEYPDAKVVRSFIAKGRGSGETELRYVFKGWAMKFHELPPMTEG